MGLSKFCQHNVTDMRKEHLRSKAHVKKGESACRTLSDGKNNVKEENNSSKLGKNQMEFRNKIKPMSEDPRISLPPVFFAYRRLDFTHTFQSNKKPSLIFHGIITWDYHRLNNSALSQDSESLSPRREI